MGDLNKISELRVLLSELYPKASMMRVVVNDVGLEDTRINWTGNAITQWHEILAEAHKQEPVAKVVERAELDYSAKSEVLWAAYQAYSGDASLTPAASEAARQESSHGTRELNRSDNISNEYLFDIHSIVESAPQLRNALEANSLAVFFGADLPSRLTGVPSRNSLRG